MCCIDTENYKCCCGCTLTVGTWILGGLVTLDMILAFVYGNWWQGAPEIILVVFFALTVVNMHSVLYRKLLFYVYMIGSILYIIGAIIVIIIVATWPDRLAENVASECMTNSTMIDYFDSPAECLDDMQTYLLVFVIVVCVISIPINLLCLRMLYYGMKEQIEYSN